LRPNRYVVARRGTHVAVPVVVAAVAVAAAGGVALLLLLLPFVFFAVVAPSAPQ
jgi:TRAP-type C4-dicarboxylate transport system permease small subunit